MAEGRFAQRAPVIKHRRLMYWAHTTCQREYFAEGSENVKGLQSRL